MRSRGKSILTRSAIATVFGAVALTATICEQILAEDAPATTAPSQATRTIQTPERPLTTAPESIAPALHPPVRFDDVTTDKPSGPQIKTIRGQRPKGPDRAKVTIVGRPNQRARIIGEDGEVEWLERRPMLPSPSAAPSVRRTRHSNQYEQAYKRQALRERLDIRPSARPTIASGTTRPRVVPTPPPARRHSPKSPQRPTAPKRDPAER